jgi:hypothetical protein
MLFQREPEPGDEEISLFVPEEETTTPTNLIGIGMFAAFGFLAMAGLSQPETRGAPLFVGALILLLLALTGLFLWWQSRYGSATLKAKAALTHGTRFEGWIETEFTSPPGPVKIAIEGRHNKYVTLYADELVEPARMQKSAAGHVRIPFSLPIPNDERAVRVAGVRVMARTKTWPVGWGATFLVK